MITRREFIKQCAGVTVGGVMAPVVYAMTSACAREAKAGGSPAYLALLGGAEVFPETVQKALLEMYRQVGTAKIDDDGLVRRGLMIRHLVMPNDVAKTKLVVEWIATHLPKDTYVNIMSQYTPVYRAKEYPEIARRITRSEYAQALKWAREAGLTRVESQRMQL